MTDVHIRLLKRIARQQQRALDDHDACDQTAGPASTQRRQHLQELATRADTRATHAQTQRHRREAKPVDDDRR